MDVPYIREPALVLSQIGNETPEDGFLTMSKVMALTLNADVVALTACKTALGRQFRGEGVLGLGRAFQFAGARNVLMSLWSVDQRSTELIAETFFRRLRTDSKATPRDAIRAARVEARRQGFRHPFFWAPFILMTD